MMSKTTCPHCGKVVDVTKFGKLAPHKDGNIRCAGSGARVSKTVKEMANVNTQ